MTDKELRRLSKLDLIELLEAQKEENERLQQELEAANARLNERTIQIEKAGTMAEAALLINGVLESAQRAADQYLYNIRQRADGEKSTTLPSPDTGKPARAGRTPKNARGKRNGG